MDEIRAGGGVSSRVGIAGWFRIDGAGSSLFEKGFWWSICAVWMGFLCSEDREWKRWESCRVFLEYFFFFVVFCIGGRLRVGGVTTVDVSTSFET